jgi:dolichol kinase
MDHALLTTSQSLANDLRSLLEEIDPARWRDDLETAARQRADAIMERLHGLPGDAASTGEVQLVERLGQLRATLDQALGALPTRESLAASAQSARVAWAAFQHDVQPAYEALAASLRGMTLSAPAPLRPTNYHRNAFHITTGLTVVALTEVLPSRLWLILPPLAFAIFAWGSEVSRRIWPGVNDGLMRLFGRVAHVHERHRVNSATWFVTAVLILGVAFPRYGAAAGVSVLALADPAAALIGRRFGRTRLRAGRSLQGTVAFFVVGALASFTALALFHPAGLGAMALTAVAASLSGAVAELYTERLDDNFTIPLAAASAAIGVGTLVGLA